MVTAERYSALVLCMVHGLVEHGDHVSVEVLAECDSSKILVVVHPDDVRHVVGPVGRTARAIRCILGACGRGGPRIVLVVNGAGKPVDTY